MCVEAYIPRADENVVIFQVMTQKEGKLRFSQTQEKACLVTMLY